MSNSIPIEQAATHLAELVGNLKPGDEIVLTSHDRPVARLLPSQSKSVRRKDSVVTAFPFPTLINAGPLGKRSWRARSCFLFERYEVIWSSTDVTSGATHSPG
jgi:antitoxin (DNA-binding transcriptional repressor) of toxin-antitoxin stability system